MAKATCISCGNPAPGTPVYMSGIRVLGSCCRTEIAAEEPTLYAKLSRRIERARTQVAVLAHALKPTVPVRPAGPAKPSTTPDADRAADFLKFF